MTLINQYWRAILIMLLSASANQWLTDCLFGRDLFAVSVVVLALLALATISTQIFHGARANPASILRTE